MQTIEITQDFLAIQELELIRELNQHSSCKIIASIGHEQVANYEGLTQDQHVKLVYSNEILFVGILNQCQIRTTAANAVVELTLASNSMLDDRERTNYYYCDVKQDFRSVLKELNDVHFKKNKLILKTIPDDKYETALLQVETNFAFLQRMCQKTNTAFSVDDLSSESRIRIGQSDKTQTIDLENRCYEQVLEPFAKIYTVTYPINQASEVNAYELGAQIKWKTYSGCYFRQRVFWQNGQLYSQWSLQQNWLPTDVNQIPNLELPAIVISNDDPEKLGRVQVKMLEMKQTTQELAKTDWILVQTPAKHFISLPEKDDLVTVKYMNEQFSVETSIQKQKFEEKHQNPQEKHWFNSYQKQIHLNEEAIVIESKSGTIQMSDEQLKMTMEQTEFIMDQNSVQFQQGNNKLILNKEGIYLEHENTKVSLTEVIQLITKKGKAELSGDFKLELPENLEVSAKKAIHLKSETQKLEGSQKIEINSKAVDFK